MKKYLLLIAILFIPFVVNAEECDTSKVYIDSIIVDKNNNVEEVEPATANGKNINLKLSMESVGDNIKYKITIKNESNDDYILDKNSIDLTSNYIDYKIELDNSNVIKANSSRTVFLKIQYKNEVPEISFNENGYIDNVSMKFNLSTDEIANPNTITNFIIVISILLLMSIAYIVFRKSKYSKVMILLILLLIPFSVKALCKCDISINSNIVIQPPVQEMRYITCQFTEHSTMANPDKMIVEKVYKFRNGMTLEGIRNSNEFFELNTTFNGNYINFNARMYPIEFYNCINSVEYAEKSVDIDKYNAYWDNFYTCKNNNYDYSSLTEYIEQGYDIENIPIQNLNKYVYYYDGCHYVV